jgi:putative tryptophan/tyrosine transport system permease protein
MDFYCATLNLGLLYFIMTLGIYISYRIYDLPDITVDGSFTIGGAVCAVLLFHNVHPLVAIMLGSLGGGVAGVLTGLIHTKLNVNGILAGIIVMTGLYSVNLHIMQRANIPLINNVTIFNIIQRFNIGFSEEMWLSVVLTTFTYVVIVAFSLFFISDFGVLIRASGNNPTMVAALGSNVDSLKILSLGMANALVACCGALIAQYQGFADIGMGTGTIVLGLASLIIGEAIFKTKKIYVKLLFIAIGTVIFRYMVAMALLMGLNPIDLKLITSAFVLMTILFGKVPHLKQWFKKV